MLAAAVVHFVGLSKNTTIRHFNISDVPTQRPGRGSARGKSSASVGLSPASALRPTTVGCVRTSQASSVPISFNSI